MGERLVRWHGEFLPDFELIPTRQHQCHDELLQFEKELAALIYFQRDMEGRNY